jgi:hypothetical protein
MINVKITNELCEFVGAVIGDGNLWTDGSRYRIELAGDPLLDRKYFDYLRKLSYTIFAKEPYAFRVRHSTIYFRLQSRSAFNVFLQLGMKNGRKARTIIIPKAIVNKGWKYLKYTIRGIFDTDGTVFYSKKTYKKAIYPTIEIRTYSRDLATQVSTLLNKNGFRARPRGNDRNGFHVALYGNAMLKKWIEEIGSSNERHINKVKQLFYSSRRSSLTRESVPLKTGRLSVQIRPAANDICSNP